MATLGIFGAETGHEHAEGLTAVGTGTHSFDTGTVYSGARSFLFDSTGSNLAKHLRAASIFGTNDRKYWIAGRFRLPTAVNSRILAVRNASATAELHLQINTSNQVFLSDQSFVQIGSAGSYSTNTWHHFLIEIDANSATDDEVALWIDGVEITRNTGAYIAVPQDFSFGFTNAPTASKTIYFDDVIARNDQGSNNAGIGDERIVALKPTADGTRNNWVAGAGGTTNLYQAIDNIPPVGVDSASATNTSQIENATSAANNAVTFTMESYTTAGVGGSDTVRAIAPLIEGGNSSTTGTDTLDIWIASNPNGSGSPTVANIDVNDGTYPTGWNRTLGTVLENPTVTLGTSPTLTIEKNVATTRVNTVCLAVIYVVYEVSSLVEHTRTMPQDAHVLVTSKRTASQDAHILVVGQRTAPQDAHIRVTSTRTVPQAATITIPVTRVTPQAAHIKTTNVAGGGQLWTPEIYTDGTDLVRWYDPAQNAVQTDNTVLSQLDDQSPNADPITALGYSGNDAPRIFTNVINGYAVVDFTGTNYLDTEGSIGITGDRFTVIQVWRRDNATGASAKDDYWTSRLPNDTFSTHSHNTFSGDSFHVMATYENNPAGAGDYVVADANGWADTDWHIIVEVWDGANSFFSHDGVVYSGDPFDFGDDTNLSNANIANGITIAWDGGTTGSNPFLPNVMQGQLAHFAILGYAARLPEVHKWEGWLADRFNLPLASGHPYETNPPTVPTMGQFAHVSEHNQVHTMPQDAHILVVGRRSSDQYAHITTADLKRTMPQDAHVRVTVTRVTPQAASITDQGVRSMAQAAHVAVSSTRSMDQAAHVRVTSTRTASQDAHILTALTRSMAQDASILTALTRSMDQAAHITTADLTRTAPQDAHITTADLMRSMGQDAHIRVQGVRTAPQAASVQETPKRTAPQAARISTPDRIRSMGQLAHITVPTELLRQMPQAAHVQVTSTRTASQDAHVQVTSTRTAPQAASIAAGLRRSMGQAAHITTANLLRSTSQDAHILTPLTRTMAQAAHVAVTSTRSVGQDAHILVPTTRSMDQAAHVLTAQARSMAQAAHVAVSSTRSMGQDAHVRVTSTRSMDQSAHVLDVWTRSMAQAAHVAVSLVRTMGQDAHISDVRTRTMGQLAHISAPEPTPGVVVGLARGSQSQGQAEDVPDALARGVTTALGLAPDAAHATTMLPAITRDST